MGKRGPYGLPVEVLDLNGMLDHCAKKYRNVKRRSIKKIKKYPVCPSTYSEETQHAWKCWVEWLVDGGVIQESDMPSLLLLADSFEMWAISKNALTEFDKQFDPSNLNQIKARASLVTQVLNSMRSFQQLADRFGLTPSARSRIEVPVSAEGKRVDRLEDLYK